VPPGTAAGASDALLAIGCLYWGLPGACPRFTPLDINVLNPLRTHLRGPAPQRAAWLNV